MLLKFIGEQLSVSLELVVFADMLRCKGAVSGRDQLTFIADVDLNIEINIIQSVRLLYALK